MVVSGSCALVTGSQIRWSAAHGFFEIGIQPEKLFENTNREIELKRVAQMAISALRKGTSVIVHSAIGLSDPRILKTKKKVENLGLNHQMVTNTLGEALGSLTKRIIIASGVKRLVLVGGDISGRITQVLGISAFQVGKPVGIAAPLCYTYSTCSELHGLQIALKGGQVGDNSYFNTVCNLRMPDFNKVALGNIKTKKVEPKVRDL